MTCPHLYAKGTYIFHDRVVIGDPVCLHCGEAENQGQAGEALAALKDVLRHVTNGAAAHIGHGRLDRLQWFMPIIEAALTRRESE